MNIDTVAAARLAHPKPLNSKLQRENTGHDMWTRTPPPSNGHFSRRGRDSCCNQIVPRIRVHLDSFVQATRCFGQRIRCLWQRLSFTNTHTHTHLISVGWAHRPGKCARGSPCPSLPTGRQYKRRSDILPNDLQPILHIELMLQTLRLNDVMFTGKSMGLQACSAVFRGDRILLASLVWDDVDRKLKYKQRARASNVQLSLTMGVTIVLFSMCGRTLTHAVTWARLTVQHRTSAH